MLAASTHCWRMVRGLRSHGRCWLVVSSDEMSPYATRSRTSSVTDRRLITDLSTAPYDQKDLCVFCRTYTSVESLATKSAGPLKRPSSSTIASLHDITGSFTSCYKSDRLLTRLRLLNYVVLLTQHQYVVQSSYVTPLNLLIGCRPVTSSFSDDPLSQFTAKPFLRSLQAREATYRCQRLKVNIYNNILICQPPITYMIYTYNGRWPTILLYIVQAEVQFRAPLNPVLANGHSLKSTPSNPLCLPEI